MEETIKILMIDDHPMIIEGYKNTILSTKKETQHLEIDIANNSDEALNQIKNSIQLETPYDLLFIDISIPPSEDGTITSGIDVAMHVREVLPAAKIVILTMFNEPYRIHNIIHNVNPEGFLIKSDLTSSELASAFQAVLNNPPFYSITVSSFIRKDISSDIKIDEIDREILHLLSQGVRTKNINQHIDLSLSAIEKRKRHLKQLFSIEDGEDETLIKEARMKGFIL